MNNANNQNLHKILNEELTVMMSLVQLLEQEQNILVENQPSLLEEVTSNKNKCLILLGDIGKKRMSEFSQLEITGGQASINDFFESSIADNKLKQVWHDLMTVSSKAQEMNKTNGLLINRQLNVNQSTLNILQQTNANESLYGANGQSKSNPTSGRGYVVG